MSPKKLIETSIPLKEINEASAREKSIRHKHPSTLHLWWARRPLAAARAVLWASLVDDPGTDSERQRLHSILKQLVQWENTNNSDVLDQARAELPQDLPDFLDPFAGGGSIPLEAQRLGLTVHAHDLNPIAVIINKAMIEIPPKFAGQPPVNPESRKNIGHDTGWEGASGLADDVNYYGSLLRDEAFSRIGHMYPKAGPSTVIAWIWARTVKCPNPACGCDMPLVSSFTLSTKHKARVVPHVDGKSITYTVETGGSEAKTPKTGRGKFRCVACGREVGTDYLHEEFTAHRDGRVMIGVVAEGRNGRVYESPLGEEHVRAADVPMPEDFPDAEMNQDTTDLISGRGYGFTHWHQLFTNRQLTMLTVIADLVEEIRERVREDAESAGRVDAEEYSRAVGVYLGFVVDKLAAYHSSICLWHTGRDIISHTFGRQAIPMVWNYAEANPFSNSTGCINSMLSWIVEVLENLPACASGEASQHNAQAPESFRNVIISTDPPYYDNIGYADLSDYFYIWLRRTLRDVYPELFRRVLVPKSEELIAAPYRHNNDPKAARKFFEGGMSEAFRNLYDYAGSDYPVTVYYAYKQKDTEDDGVISNGWETMLGAVIKAGFQVVRTWPMRTELTTALKAKVGALGSSVVLVLRKRSPNAPSATRTQFLRELREELKPALDSFLKDEMSPVDIPQSAIGPGMAVYSRYSRIAGTDGTEVGVREALSEVNRAIDEILLPIDLDSETRFCVELYKLCGLRYAPADDVNKIATAKNAAVDSLRKRGLIESDGGRVRLVGREELGGRDESLLWVLTQELVHAMESGGVEACAEIVHRVGSEYASDAKELAYYLYTVAENNRWAREGLLYNNLVSEWASIIESANKITLPTEISINYDTEER